MTVTAHLHGGDRDGETFEMPWARLEMSVPRPPEFVEDEGKSLLYRLRPPWRGQELAHYDYVDTDEKAEAA